MQILEQMIFGAIAFPLIVVHEGWDMFFAFKLILGWWLFWLFMLLLSRQSRNEIKEKIRDVKHFLAAPKTHRDYYIRKLPLTWFYSLSRYAIVFIVFLPSIPSLISWLILSASAWYSIKTDFFLW